MKKYRLQKAYDFCKDFMSHWSEGGYFPYYFYAQKNKSKSEQRILFNKVKRAKLSEFKDQMRMLERYHIIDSTCPYKDLYGFCKWLDLETTVKRRTKKRKYFYTACQKLTIVYYQTNWELYFAIWDWFGRHRDELIAEGIIKEEKNGNN